MQEHSLTHRSPKDIATIISAGFQIYRNRYQEITVGAKKRFERAAWLDERKAGHYRLLLYKEHLRSVVLHLTHPEVSGPEVFGPKVFGNEALNDQSHGCEAFDWPLIKHSYVGLIKRLPERELYETFFNSVQRQITQDTFVDHAHMFVESEFTKEPLPEISDIYYTYRSQGDLVQMIEELLNSFNFYPHWKDLLTDAGNILRCLAEDRPEIKFSAELEVQMLKTVFYRNKAAYLIGKIVTQEGAWPAALPILINADGLLYVDTIICDADELSVVFSFSRSYFMADTPSPAHLVAYLHTLLPQKTRSELYSALGFHKHGKTEFYRDFVIHLETSKDEFVIAPGIPGMVMCVFILPSYRTVFKVIKDRFAPPKKTTPEKVKQSYTLVKRHDRVGRMADTQEFTNLKLPRSRFSESLLEELRSAVDSSITISDEYVVIKHLYTERLMTPLNLYIENEKDNAEGLRNALDEYGNAIKELAAANIFPGDLLLKNFGITRHGRVVFYDYDEICYLAEVNFRKIPEPRTPEEEMSAEIWYTVGAHDVFPEEFVSFLFARPLIKKMFIEMHGELFTAEYWKQLQQSIKEGVVGDIFPYRRKKRFARQLRISNKL